ncbi:uncharacterized protein BO66DRAFT_140199 [Aspergillus aculeatinus CBS 121060]|uniref:Uncharacterized protein n=1 Tax=Aspergillus aculeatinus CBS 121060 TaxID=1448322 RepID=A0ACD1H340_9EURO|nr:hypothetical protein BO66DRAFT_140199 [Aspergillus aculeatinus CBS 121060]RAH67836.1 hypothetical protein BO66DRAFT_140199 [Aspergillus aculeatinus CBS 121060]
MYLLRPRGISTLNEDKLLAIPHCISNLIYDRCWLGGKYSCIYISKLAIPNRFFASAIHKP